MKEKIIKPLSLALTFALVLSLIAGVAFAADGDAVDGVTYMDAHGDTQVKDGVFELSTSRGAATLGNGGETWYLLTGTFTNNGVLTVNGDVHFVLGDNCDVTVSGGIRVEGGSSLTIYAQSSGTSMGSLTAVGLGAVSGIGGGNNTSCGTITINGGAITATGGTNVVNSGAGIGGGYGGGGGVITINGGAITATAGGTNMNGAGIGGGADGGGFVITINGGEIIASGGGYGAGIGGGERGGDCDITINGGDITATGGFGAGIGGGYYGSGGKIVITGGTITASANGGAGIGGGLLGGGGDIRILGGTVSGTSFYGAGIGGGSDGNGGYVSISGEGTVVTATNTNNISYFTGKQDIGGGVGSGGGGILEVSDGAELIMGQHGTDAVCLFEDCTVTDNSQGGTPETFGALVLDALPAILDISRGNISIFQGKTPDTLRVAYDIPQKISELPADGSIEITGTTTEFGILIGNDAVAKIELNGVSVKMDESTSACAFLISDGATAYCTLVGNNTLQSSQFMPGVRVSYLATLVIDGDGELTAQGGANEGSGIGSPPSTAFGDISILSGTVNAIGIPGGMPSAGIGGGRGDKSGDILISGTNTYVTVTQGIGADSLEYEGMLTVADGATVEFLNNSYMSLTNYSFTDCAIIGNAGAYEGHYNADGKFSLDVDTVTATPSSGDMLLRAEFSVTRDTGPTNPAPRGIIRFMCNGTVIADVNVVNNQPYVEYLWNNPLDGANTITAKYIAGTNDRYSARKIAAVEYGTGGTVNPGEISGNVRNSTGAVVTAEVSLAVGSTPLDGLAPVSLTIAGGGSETFLFGGVSDGFYNVVVKVEPNTLNEYFVTKAVEIRGGSQQSTINFSLTVGKTQSVIEQEDGTPDMAVNGMDELFEPSDIAVATSGGSVEIKLVGKSEDTTSAEASGIKSAMQANGHGSLEILNLTVVKTITDGGAPTETPLTELNSLIEVVLQVNNSHLVTAVYRSHDYNDGNGAVVELLPRDDNATVWTATTECYKIIPGYVVLYVDKFSVYAMAYAAIGDSVNNPATNETELATAIIAANANSGGTIYVSGTFELTTALPEITSDITIQGPAEGAEITLGGSEDFRHFYSDTANITFALKNLTLTGINNGGTSGGGGVTMRGTGSKLVMDNCTVQNCYLYGTDGGGGGVWASIATLTNCTITGNTTNFNGGGIYTSQTATLINCTISGNSSNTIGGGVGANVAILTNCTVSGNSAVRMGGGVHTTAYATMVDCTVTDNSASDDGGGVFSAGNNTLTNCAVTNNSADDGGGVYTTQTSLLTNCTITNNSATSDGGGVFARRNITLTNSTVTGNTAGGRGGGVWASSNTYVTIHGSIVAGNTDGYGCDVGVGVSAWSGATETPGDPNYNIIGTGTYSLTDIFGTDTPSLADNGGATPTILINANGTAYNAIPQATLTGWGITTDQRTITRPQGLNADVGAVELAVCALTIQADANGSVTTGVDGNYAEGEEISIEATPDSGYIFSAWTATGGSFSNASAASTTFTMPGSAATITASFAEYVPPSGGWINIEKPQDKPWENPFEDVFETDWFYEDVEHMHTNDLMQGTDTVTFSPNAPLTRGMVVTVLWRIEGCPSSGDSNVFTDVPFGQWYSEATSWAAENGVVKGYGDGRFGPNDFATREQLAAMLYRYIQYKGGGFEDSWMFLLDYADRSEISEWAYEAVCYLTVNKFVEGRQGNLFTPSGTATRAEFAAMLHRYLVWES